MRTLKRNQKIFYYSNFDKQDEIEDEYGNKTGQYDPSYGEPILVRGNISAATGSTQLDEFGTFVSYDKVIICDDMTLPIDEHSILFVDVHPIKNDEGKWVNDYIVKKVAKSLNTISYAISRVTQS